jgi:hypothetical protein
VAKLATVGKYLKYTDIPDNEDTILTIKRVSLEKFEKDGKSDAKWCLFFEEIEQGLALNKINTDSVRKATGVDDTDDLPGKRIALFVKEDVEYAGEMVSAIRVRPKAVK